MTTHISNTFSFSRLMMVIKRDFVENWKQNLHTFLSIYAAFLIAALMAYKGTKDIDPTSIYFAYRLGFFTAVGIISYFLFHISAAHIMDVLQTKEKRIAFHMLPATQTEKFVARALQAVVGCFLMIAAALFLTEITRLILLPIIGAPAALQHFCLFDLQDIIFKGLHWNTFESAINNAELDQIKNTVVFNTICWMLATHSMFILGGTYFYKRPYIKTFSYLVLGTIIVSFFLGNEFLNLFVETSDRLGFTVTHSIFNLTITVVCWSLSYYLFTHSQVTERVNFKFLKRG